MEVDPVIRWKMNANETTVHRLAKLWESETNKLFPGNNYPKLPSTGDPRKSYLFKVCWQLYRETKDVLKSNEYELYIHANLYIIKSCKGYVNPTVLCGEKAMVRYKLWKSWYKDVLHERQEIDGVDPKTAADLRKTKEFLFEKCDGEPTVEKLKSLPDLHVAVGLGNISQAYAVYSPLVERAGLLPQFEHYCMFSAELVRSKINEDTKKFLRELFAYEFKR